MCLKDQSPLFVGLFRSLWIVNNLKVRLFPFQNNGKDSEISYGSVKEKKKEIRRLIWVEIKVPDLMENPTKPHPSFYFIKILKG